jgi:hypothetical protein
VAAPDAVADLIKGGISMTKAFFVTLVSVAFAGAMPSLSLAKNHDEPGVPGEPNCHGQTMAFFNQLGGELDPRIHGIGNIAEASALTVQELQALVDEFCNPPDDDGDNG